MCGRVDFPITDTLCEIKTPGTGRQVSSPARETEKDRKREREREGGREREREREREGGRQEERTVPLSQINTNVGITYSLLRRPCKTGI